MRANLAVGICGLCFLGTPGCGGDSSAHEHLGKEKAQLMQKMADEMQNLLKADPENVKEIQGKIKKFGEQLDALAQKIKELPGRVQTAIGNKYKPELDQAGARVERLAALLRNKPKADE